MYKGYKWPELDFGAEPPCIKLCCVAPGCLAKMYLQERLATRVRAVSFIVTGQSRRTEKDLEL